MTEAERSEHDANPLWSETGQVLWLLEQQDRDDELLTAAEIARRLDLTRSAVVHALWRLQREGRTREWKVDQRERWGTYDHVLRWLERKRLEERRTAAEGHVAGRRVAVANEALAAAAQRLRASCVQRGVEVAVLGDRSEEAPGPRKHLLMLSVDDPEAATWLVRRLTCPEARG